MANDLDVRRKYVGKIGDWLSSKPNHIAQVSALGGRVVHMSMVIHEDGTVTYNSATVCEPADDDEEYVAIKPQNVNYYHNPKGKGQFHVAENIPINRAGNLTTHQFVSILPPYLELNRNVYRQTPVGFRNRTLAAEAVFFSNAPLIGADHAINSKIAGMVLSDSMTRQYQQALK